MSTTTVTEATFPATMSYPLRVRVRHQGFAFTRRDALKFGASDEELRTWCRSGVIHSATQGAYYLASNSSSDLSGNDETSRRRARATLLALGGDYFATHLTALLAWELPTAAMVCDHEIHVGHTGARRWCRRAGVRLHRVSPDAAITTHHGLRTVSAAYAVAQMGAVAGVEAAVIAADAALHSQLVSLSDLDEALKALSGTPGIAGLATLLDLVDARSESPGESRTRLIFQAAGIPVTPQAVIRDEAGHFVARVDLLVDNSNVIVEFDGLLKYRGEANQEALVNEKRREVALQRLGYRVVRFVWSDLAEPDRMVGSARDNPKQPSPRPR